MRDAARSLAPLLGPETFVVPLENGVEAAADAAAEVGAERVVGGLCRLMSYIARPGVIRHAGVDPSIVFGELGRIRSPRVEALAAAFAPAQGVQARISDDIEAAIWEKFLFIAPFSGVGALTGLPAGPLRSDPAIREMLRQAMEEVVALARSRGVQVREGAVERTMAFADALPETATASMQRDILEGKPSELEAQTGAIVRLARAAGLPVPVNQGIYQSLLPKERAARPAN